MGCCPCDRVMAGLQRSIRFVLLLVAAASFGCRSVVSHEPLNLSDAKAAVVAYHDSGAYHRDIDAVADEASAWLEGRAVRRVPGERLAVVFDIDETVLSNYDQMVSLDFGYTASGWRAWVLQAEAPVIPPMKRVYDVARRLDIAVVFLTGRDDPEERVATARNLAQHGMGEYAQLIMAAAIERSVPAARRKAEARAALERGGYTIIASMGDQHSDLVGGHAERTFKVPNPFYRIP